MSERFYPVPDYPSYEVSTYGRVRRVGSTSCLSTFKKGNTYQVTLSQDGHQYTTSTAHLVRISLPHEVAVQLGWIRDEAHYMRYLPASVEAEIRTLEGVVSLPEVAQEFGVSESTVLAIWRRAG